jgi:adenine/guanine/hypoxanthine permease
MHGDRLGISQSPTVAASYLIVGFILVAASKFAVASPALEVAGELEEEEDEIETPGVLAKS